MRQGSDAAVHFFGDLTIEFFVEKDPETDGDIEQLAQKLDVEIDRIEELIRLNIILPNEFALVTER